MCLAVGQEIRKDLGSGAALPGGCHPSSVCFALTLLLVITRVFLATPQASHFEIPDHSPSASRPPDCVPVLFHIYLQITSMQGRGRPGLLC